LIINMTREMNDKEIYSLRKEILKSMSKYSKFSVPLKIKKINPNVNDLYVRCPFCKKIIRYGNCFLKDKINYSFIMRCRNCKMCFYIVSEFKKWVFKNYYKFYHQIRKLKEIKSILISKFKRKKFKIYN